MVFALSTAHMIGLACAGVIFITFALLSSFYFPSRDPNFPGKSGLRWYIPLCAVLFVGMLSSVLVFGQEEKEAEAAPPTATSTTGGGGGGQAPSGNAANGKAVFMSTGCGACHTFTPAGTSGKVG